MKKTSSNTAESAVKAMLNAAKGLPPPPKHCRMRPSDLPFWDGIMRSRARDEWTGADLVVGVQLARCQADIEAEQSSLDTEGMVIGSKSARTINPRIRALELLSKRELALMRALRMCGFVAMGSEENEAGRRKIERESIKLREELAGDELLAV